jgi:hypothetical protein
LLAYNGDALWKRNGQMPCMPINRWKRRLKREGTTSLTTKTKPN